ncbi:MAG TPA: aminotransferase class IV, partial [Chitinophagaceae bacterium]|nr:aminotransferase class IV [Chitinophagaceae bacterium]
MNFVNCNGKIVAEGKPLFTAQNRSFKYGDGIFETMKVSQGKLVLAGYHFDRLFTSIRLLQLTAEKKFTAHYMQNEIKDLCHLNKCSDLARVRLAVYRGDKNKAEYLLEAFAIDAVVNNLNEKGWQIDIYPFAQKSCDAFANLKSANYLPYVLADLYAKEKELNECLLLNSSNKICDASKANVFLISNADIFTPALHQGCINGVMRRHVIEEAKKRSYIVHQTEISEEMITNADEVFLTNAIQGIRWVSRFR